MQRLVVLDHHGAVYHVFDPVDSVTEHEWGWVATDGDYEYRIARAAGRTVQVDPPVPVDIDTLKDTE